MEIKEFVEEVKKQIDNFEKDFIERNKKDPKLFPNSGPLEYWSDLLGAYFDRTEK